MVESGFKFRPSTSKGRALNGHMTPSLSNTSLSRAMWYLLVKMYCHLFPRSLVHGHLDGLQHFATKSNTRIPVHWCWDVRLLLMSRDMLLPCQVLWSAGLLTQGVSSALYKGFLILWGCERAFTPHPWQYQVYHWWFKLQFLIIRLNSLSFLMTSWFSSLELPVFSSVS